MRAYESSSAAAAAEEEEAALGVVLPAIKFTLDGEEFRCLTEMTGDALLEWSELGVAASDDTPANSPEAAGYFARFLHATFGPAEYARLRRHIRAHGTPPRVVMQIIAGIQEEITGAVEDLTGRPTVPSSPSSPGGGDPVGERARVVSLARGEVTFVDPPPRKQPQDRKAKGGGQRKRAPATGA